VLGHVHPGTEAEATWWLTAVRHQRRHAIGSMKHVAGSSSKTRRTPMNRGRGNARARKLGSPPKAAMAECTMHRWRPCKPTTVAVNPLEASRSTGEGDSRTSQGERCGALHWSGHGEPLTPARPGIGDGGRTPKSAHTVG
jgi:hypothetical protein